MTDPFFETYWPERAEIDDDYVPLIDETGDEDLGDWSENIVYTTELISDQLLCKAWQQWDENNGVLPADTAMELQGWGFNVEVLCQTWASHKEGGEAL